MSKEISGKLTMKDIIVASVLGVVCIAIRFLFMILGGIAPVVWLASHAIDALLIGPVFMLVIAKTKRTGPIFIISLVSGIVFLTASVYILVSSIIFGVLSELALRLGKFRNRVWIIVSYIFFSFAMIGDFFQLWSNKAAFLEYSAEFGMDAGYLAALDQLISTPTILLIIAGIIVCALLGGLFGFRLMKKHFAKTGIAV